MTTLLKADIFFFVTTIVVVIVAAFLIVALYYLIRSLRQLSFLLDRMGDDIEHAAEYAKEIVQHVRESVLFNFLFRKKRKK